ncbi:MAG: prepilin-type N-terminal cleavage/methylation domain-containing protein [Myxococcota bacterium]
MSNRKGFTLVELMIVVAIIGILAAIAIPNFVNMQLRAKRAEVPANVDGIKTAELAYDAAFDEYITAAAVPAAVPGKAPTAWPSTSGGFETIGWSPDGDVRGQYEVSGVTATTFTVTGTCDVDGDADNAVYTASQNQNAELDAGDVNVY